MNEWINKWTTNIQTMTLECERKKYVHTKVYIRCMYIFGAYINIFLVQMYIYIYKYLEFSYN